MLGGEEERKKLRSRRGECCLCNQVITYNCFKEHMVITHLPEESCHICGREIPAREFRHHWEYCDTGDIGRDIGKNEKCEDDGVVRLREKSVIDKETSNVLAENNSNTSTLCGVANIIPVGDITQVKNKHNDENLSIKEETNNVETWMKLNMSFVDDQKPVSRVMKLKSSATVLRALKKFSTVINIKYRKLKFCCRGEQLIGTELASKIEDGEVVVVRRRM